MEEIFIIYGITDCPSCIRACADLMERGIEYVFVQADFSKAYRIAITQALHWPTFPIVIRVLGEEESLIGGYDELSLLLK
tara:strand:- start:1313 stop:1552 length:240 start_codon:yes stop_codon:yes gene_type:complete